MFCTAICSNVILEISSERNRPRMNNLKFCASCWNEYHVLVLCFTVAHIFNKLADIRQISWRQLCTCTVRNFAFLKRVHNGNLKDYFSNMNRFRLSSKLIKARLLIDCSFVWLQLNLHTRDLSVTVEFRIFKQFGYYAFWNPPLSKRSGSTLRLEPPTALSYFLLVCIGLKAC